MNSMHSLNLYQSWNTSEPAWSLIEPNANLNETTSPVAFFAATYLANSHMLFIDGGITTIPTTTSLQQTLPSSLQQPQQSQSSTASKKSQTIYYDTVKGLWVNPAIKGTPLVRR
jgi:hypothetical protein